MNTFLTLMPWIVLIAFLGLVGFLIIHDKGIDLKHLSAYCGSEKIQVLPDLVEDISLLRDNKITQAEFVERLFKRIGLQLPEVVRLKFKG